MQIVAPHYCYGCGKIGTLLCENCKYDITEESFSGCIVCAGPAAAGICTSCRTSYERAWCVGERDGALQRLIDAYKFERVKDADSMLASLLYAALADIPSGIVVTHVPTVQSHIRVRGYDHARNLARQFARMRDLRHADLIERIDSGEQRGLSKKQRLAQAKSAYRCRKPAEGGTTYLLIDDIVTTNASVRYAVQALVDAGAKEVWIAALAGQPLKTG